MKKVNCYPIKYRIFYLVGVSIGLFLLVYSLLCLPYNAVIELIVFTVLLSGSTLFFAALYFHYMQTLYVKDGKLVLTTPFYKIKELDIDSCRYSVISLETKINRCYSQDKWICIYAQGETNLFDEGLSNSRKYDRIQLICTDKNLAFIKEILEKENPDEND